MIYDVDKLSTSTKYRRRYEYRRRQKYRWRQNIAGDKISPATKIWASTKYRCRQNINGNKISLSTKYRRRQNIDSYKISVDKILTLTKYRHWQNIDVDKISPATKISASTKYWRRQNINVYTNSTLALPPTSTIVPPNLCQASPSGHAFPCPSPPPPNFIVAAVASKWHLETQQDKKMEKIIPSKLVRS